MPRTPGGPPLRSRGRRRAPASRGGRLAALERRHGELLLGDALSGYDRAQLRFWMEGDAVNIERFQAGLPADWLIADRTATGEHGSANDVGVVWTADGTPLTIAVLTTKPQRTATPDDALVATAAHVVAGALS